LLNSLLGKTTSTIFEAMTAPMLLMDKVKEKKIEGASWAWTMPGAERRKLISG
jgi:hypothetical protein